MLVLFLLPFCPIFGSDTKEPYHSGLVVKPVSDNLQGLIVPSGCTFVYNQYLFCFGSLLFLICIGMKLSIHPNLNSFLLEAYDIIRKEVQIVYRLFLVNCYLLHVPRLPSQPASSGRGLVIETNWVELA